MSKMCVEITICVRIIPLLRCRQYRQKSNIYERHSYVFAVDFKQTNNKTLYLTLLMYLFQYLSFRHKYFLPFCKSFIWATQEKSHPFLYLIFKFISMNVHLFLKNSHNLLKNSPRYLTTRKIEKNQF